MITIFYELFHDPSSYLMIISLQAFTESRSLIAKQAMEIVQIIGRENPFDKFEVACFLYNHLINKESYQMVINSFEDHTDRDNLIHRLGINKERLIATTSSTNELANLNGVIISTPAENTVSRRNYEEHD